MLAAPERSFALNGLEAIISRIKADAQDEARRYLEAAEKEAGQILDRSQAACAEISKAAEDEAALQISDLVGRAQSMAGLERRKALLAVRQELLDDVLDQAVEQLARLADEDKLSFYKNLIQHSDLTEGELVLNEQDQKLGPALLASQEKNLGLAAETGSFAGGLIIKAGLIEENMTLESLLKMGHAELVGLAASFLFEEKDDTR